LREVPAVRRATAILHHLAFTGGGLTVTRIASDLDIIPSTCLHILRELMAAHFVAFEPNGKTYKLGFGVLGLAKQLSAHDLFIHTAAPQLESFAQEHGVSVSAQQRDGDESVVVAAATASEGLEAPLGKRVPVLSSASGRVFAAQSDWSRVQLRARFDRVRWQARPEFDQWIEEVAEAREAGYAVDNGFFRLGITSIAVAVAAVDGTVARTLSVNVVTAQLNARRSAQLLASLRSAARAIGRGLSASHSLGPVHDMN